MKNWNIILSATVTLLLTSIGIAQDLTLDGTILNALEYRCVGPTRGGRVTTVAGDANHPNTYYFGSTGGGVWKTEDYGITWKNISDGYFDSPSIGSISVAPSNSKIIYVGTGSDGMRSNVIAGKGVYKSLDAGKTWKHIGLKATGQIGAVEVHPTNPNIAYVAAIGNAFAPNEERGLYRTKDGGATWDKVLFISDTVGVVDMEFAPDNPNTIYASLWRGERKPWTIISGGKVGGIYKSTDGGDNWNKLGGGLPTGIIGKIDLAVSPANPEVLYALVEAPEGEGGLYRSNDRGATFKLMSTEEGLLDRPFYFCNVEVNPQNENTVYVMATRYYRSTNSGKNWQRLSVPHGDNHDMWINPKDTLNFIQANDGGANITHNGGKSWSTQHNQLTSELYQVEVDNQIPYWLYAGQQDNYTTIAVPSLPTPTLPGSGLDYWMATGGCETGPAVPKPNNHNIVYANCKGRFGVFDKTTGQEKQYYVGASNMYGHHTKDLKYRFQRVSPIHVSPHNPDVVYHTSQYVHKTMDDGKTWETISPDLTAFTPETQMVSGSPITRDVTGEEVYSTIYAIRESKLEEGLIWVGANDGPVHVTKDGGKNWKNVTPKSLPNGGRVDCVETSVHQEGKAYIAVLRYQLGDSKPYIFKTTDYGENWELLTTGNNGLPDDFPTRVVREDPDRAGVLYAGTEYGLFISLNDGKTWQSFQQNLPITPITDIKVHQQDLVLSTMGRAFWILDNLTPIHQLSSDIAAKKVHLFQPKAAYRMRYRSRGAVDYPSPAAIIDYHLSEVPAGELQLIILDAQRKTVAAFSSETPEEKEKMERDMSTEFMRGGGKDGLLKSKGLHRFRWDMRHEGAWDKNISRRGARGTMVAPGKYYAVLKVGNESQEVAFEVKADPRVIASGVNLADLEAQRDLALKVTALQSEAKQLAHNLEQDMEQLQSATEAKKKKKLVEELVALEAYNAQFNTAEGRYMQPMLLAQISYLNSMINRADQRPGKDAYDRFEELRKELEQLKSAYTTFREESKVLGDDD